MKSGRSIFRKALGRLRRFFISAAKSVSLRLTANLSAARDADVVAASIELNAARPERRLRMQELGDRVTISRSRVSRVVDELERAGYVERLPDPVDRRASFAAITPEGRAALRKAAPVYLAAVEAEFLSHLTDAEARSIERALDRVREA